MEFKIEKNIPIPVRGKWQELADNMQDGDSVLLCYNKAMSLLRALNKRSIITGFDGTSKKVSGNPPKFRVWKRRVKKNGI